jgi:RHH-type transcriptional regulator, proline utilization regulon repressor / proline dehydrogenase / delta 1-pyrroline-5-carboxylate dehydrogenase
VSTLANILVAAREVPASQPELEAAIHLWGERIFTLMDGAERAFRFSKKSLYTALMDWAMRDDHFKTQLFRFIDVLPSLGSSSEVTRHLREYLGEDGVSLPPALRLGLTAAGGASWLVGSAVKTQVVSLARQFMLGNDPQEIVSTLRHLHQEGIGFTVDMLGETVVSEAEADQYAQRYLDLLELLGRDIAQWPHPCRSNESPRGSLPPLNLSLKISALYSQIHPADPDTAIERISSRLRPILRRAQALRAFVNFDMESYALRPLTLRLFKTIFAEPEFAASPACGLALQAYLKDCETDLREIIGWSRARRRRLTVRLVKGAYWDYETTIAQQRRWSVPVFSHKPDTDSNFERLSLLLLESDDALDAAFGTHNVRSLAHVLAQAERLQIDPRNFEFQMLYGMADSLSQAVRQLGCRLRQYCPVGELLPGMAYLVRRLLENTSNEGFLANQSAHRASREESLRDPAFCFAAVSTDAAAPPSGEKVSQSRPLLHVTRGSVSLAPVAARKEQAPRQLDRPTGSEPFRNEPHTDFTIDAERARLVTAIRNLRQTLGRRHPLVINHELVSSRNWRPSLDPADQREVIGYAAQATVAQAESALAAARAAQPRWARIPADERAALLEHTAALLRRDKAALCALEVLEAGKTWTEADADVAEAIDFCNFYAAEMRKLARPQRTEAVAGESNVQSWWPRGVGVIIAPWNFPLAILTGMASAAVVAGNAIVLKPSDQTPVIAARLMALFIEAGLPPGVVNLVSGPGGTIGAHLVAHAQTDFIAFTGSKQVGLKIWETAARTAPGQKNLKKVVCEMGGKNCIIVDSDADLDEAVAGCIVSAFGYQGQKCSALSRLIVLAENHEKFVDRLIAGAASMRVGPAEFPGNFVGPVISREAQQRVLAVIEAGRHEASLAWQGAVPDDPNACYVPPTIFTAVPPASRLFREEIFGPVLAVSRAADLDEALALANDSEYALTGGCYSRSPVDIERVKSELVCGNLYINRAITGAIVGRQPFGGFKMSGTGSKAGGREYLTHFLIPRVVTENRLRRGFAPPDEE